MANKLKEKLKMLRYAITRKPGKNFSQGQKKSELGVPDWELALQQHTAYCQTLEQLGFILIVLEAEESYPDSPFVEDTAIVTKELAVITYPGALTRRGENDEVYPLIHVFL